MTTVRPVFTDGAILGAADLTALEQIDRDRAGRHARHLHTPGVAAGLELTTTPRANGQGVEVTMQPGYAVDGTGRELVVATAMAISADRFTGDVPSPAPSADPTLSVWYPVFVRGLDSALAAVNAQMGCQGATGATRIAEDVEIEFGRPGDAGRGDQDMPAPDAGPGSGTSRVLVGFVQYGFDEKSFVAVTAEAEGVRVPTAGARAGLVAGQRGRLELRPGPVATAGAATVMVDQDKGGSLVFGLHSGTGAVTKLMSVDSSGNLQVAGKIGDGQKPDEVLVATGTAFDGAILPLPAGADAKAIASGHTKLSIIVTPRFTAGGSQHRVLPAECRVDADRRVHCWGTLLSASGGSAQGNVATACDYLMIASTAKAGA